MLNRELQNKISLVKQNKDYSILPPYTAEVSDTVKAVSDIMLNNPEAIFISDVGNNMYITARAYAYSLAENHLYYSKNFAPLGCAVPKAIGAYYATKKPILCFVGDQGLLFNIQELHYIAQHKLPITIILLNNHESGMIAGDEIRRELSPLHTTAESGYLSPNYSSLKNAFGVEIVEIRYKE